MGVITSPNGYIFYHYIPTQPGAIVVAVLFALGTLAVLWRSISTRTKFAIPFMVGGIMEVIGYVGRAIAKERADSPLVPFILQSVLLLVAPALFAASIYMTLGRVIRSVHGEQYSIIPILGFGLFTVTALTWHVRMMGRIAGASMSNKAGRWQQILIMLYAVSVFIMVRSIFRVIEYSMGTTGYLMLHEWPLYIFDALLMLFTVGVFAGWYPGQLGSIPTASADGLDLGSDVGLESGQAAKDRWPAGHGS